MKAAEASGVGWGELAAADEAQSRQLLGTTLRPRRAAVGYVAPDLAAVHQGLKGKNVTLALLWEEYVRAAGGPTYQYSRFCDLYRDFVRRLKRSMRHAHRAGEKLFIDYAGDMVPIVDADTGEIARAQIFVAVLGASSYTFACATAGRLAGCLTPSRSYTTSRDTPSAAVPRHCGGLQLGLGYTAPTYPVAAVLGGCRRPGAGQHAPRRR